MSTGINFAPPLARRIVTVTDAYYARAKHTTVGGEAVFSGGFEPQLLFGTLTGNFTGPAETFAVQPSDVFGVAIDGADPVTVQILASGDSVYLTGITGVNLPTGTVIPYVAGVVGTTPKNLSLLDIPTRCCTGEIQVSSGMFQTKYFWNMGVVSSTVSEFTDLVGLQLTVSSSTLKLQYKLNGGSWTDLTSLTTSPTPDGGCA